MCHSLAYVPLLLLLLHSPIIVISDQPSPNDCENLGFTGLALYSNYNTFTEHVKNKVAFGLMCNMLMHKALWWVEDGALCPGSYCDTQQSTCDPSSGKPAIDFVTSQEVLGKPDEKK